MSDSSVRKPESGSAPASISQPESTATPDYPPIAELVPHAEPMLALERMIDWRLGYAECAMTVSASSRFVDSGSLRAVLTIEHMAQAVAACLGYEAYRGGQGVRVGMIVSCRDFRAHVPAVAEGDELRVVVERARGNESLSHFECAVRREGRLVSTATMTLVHDQPAPGQSVFGGDPASTPGNSPGNTSSRTP